MGLSLLPETSNGGFPEPPATGPIRVIEARHEACGEATRVRLPEAVQPRAVRRVRCDTCGEDFETAVVDELGIEGAEAAGESEFSLPEFSLPTFDELKLPAARFEPAEPRVEEPEPEPVVEEPEPEPVVEVPEPEPVLELPAPQIEEPEIRVTRERPRDFKQLRKAIEVELKQIEIDEIPDVVEAPEAEAAPRRKVKLPQVKLPKLPKLRRPKLSVPKVSRPRVSRPKLSKLDPGSTGWRLASAAAAVVAVVMLLGALQGDDKPIAPQLAAATDRSTPSDLPSAAELRAANADNDTVNGSVIPADDAPAGDSDSASGGAKNTELVRGSTYSLALPEGWERTEPAGSAAFSAMAADGSADAQLWISEDPKLDFPTFINLSMNQLESLAGSAEIVERIPGPTPETTIVRLAAEAPADQATYEVTLRAAGPYRYYLATSVQPDASEQAVEGAELIVGSFTPEAGE